MKIVIRGVGGNQATLYAVEITKYTGEAARPFCEPHELLTADQYASVFVIDVDRRQWRELHKATGSDDATEAAAPAINGMWVTWAYGDGGGPVIAELYTDELSALRAAVTGGMGLRVHCLPFGTDLAESLACAEAAPTERQAPRISQAGGKPQPAAHGTALRSLAGMCPVCGGDLTLPWASEQVGRQQAFGPVGQCHRRP